MWWGTSLCAAVVLPLSSILCAMAIPPIFVICLLSSCSLALNLPSLSATLDWLSPITLCFCSTPSLTTLSLFSPPGLSAVLSWPALHVLEAEAVVPTDMFLLHPCLRVRVAGALVPGRMRRRHQGVTRWYVPCLTTQVRLYMIASNVTCHLHASLQAPHTPATPRRLQTPKHHA